VVDRLCFFVLSVYHSEMSLMKTNILGLLNDTAAGCNVAYFLIYLIKFYEIAGYF